MAGIYLHIPFCKKACHYCDFHFSTSLKYKQEMLDCLKKELQLRKDYLGGEKIETLYFGGGTPSILNAAELASLIDEVASSYQLAADAEITLEANPDDLNKTHVQALRQIPLNRFSVGVQSFFDEDLRWMNRAHLAMEGRDAIMRIQDAGFENITADLIYGFPLLTDQKWSENIETMIGLEMPHLSCYSMTVEPGTALSTQIKRGIQKRPDDALSARQFEQLMDRLEVSGFEHYEISNFARPGKRSKHNSAYWEGKKYIGIGPSSHSYDGDSRQWNVANNHQYMREIMSGKIPAEQEVLSTKDRVNEYVMTSLRTMEGLDLRIISDRFGTDYRKSVSHAAGLISNQTWLEMDKDMVRLSRAGKLYADHIASELFVED